MTYIISVCCCMLGYVMIERAIVWLIEKGY